MRCTQLSVFKLCNSDAQPCCDTVGSEWACEAWVLPATRLHPCCPTLSLLHLDTHLATHGPFDPRRSRLFSEALV
eukprot:1600667-Amphidinium_carterae.2